MSIMRNRFGQRYKRDYENFKKDTMYIPTPINLKVLIKCIKKNKNTNDRVVEKKSRVYKEQKAGKRWKNCY